MKRAQFVATVALVTFLLWGQQGSAQPPIPPADSILFVQAFNDTAQLRQITINRGGSRIAARAHNRLGELAYKNGMVDRAEWDYRRVYDQYLNLPERPDAMLGIGKVRYKKGEFENAKAFIREFLQTSPQGENYDWARYYLLRAMRRTNDSTMANGVRVYLASSHPATEGKDDNIQYDLVRHLEERRRFDHAIAEGRRLLQVYPASEWVSDVELRIVNYYLLRKDVTAALGLCDSLVQKYPANTNNAARAQHTLATIHAGRKDFHRARIEFVKVATQHPAMTLWRNAAEYGLAIVDMSEGGEERDSTLLARALTKLQAFVASHPEDRHVPRALMDISTLSSESGQHERALDAYNRLIGFNPALIDSETVAGQSRDLRFHRSLVLKAHIAKSVLLRVHIGDAAGALAECEAMLAEQPGLTDVLLNKAVCLIDLDRIEEARLILQTLSQGESRVRGVAAQILSTLG